MSQFQESLRSLLLALEERDQLSFRDDAEPDFGQHRRHRDSERAQILNAGLGIQQCRHLPVSEPAPEIDLEAGRQARVECRALQQKLVHDTAPRKREVIPRQRGVEARHQVGAALPGAGVCRLDPAPGGPKIEALAGQTILQIAQGLIAQGGAGAGRLRGRFHVDAPIERGGRFRDLRNALEHARVRASQGRRSQDADR